MVSARPGQASRAPAPRAQEGEALRADGTAEREGDLVTGPGTDRGDEEDEQQVRRTRRVRRDGERDDDRLAGDGREEAVDRREAEQCGVDPPGRREREDPGLQVLQEGRHGLGHGVLVRLLAGRPGWRRLGWHGTASGTTTSLRSVPPSSIRISPGRTLRSPRVHGGDHESGVRATRRRHPVEGDPPGGAYVGGTTAAGGVGQDRLRRPRGPAGGARPRAWTRASAGRRRRGRARRAGGPSRAARSGPASR